MKYMGSKQKHSKRILDIMLNNRGDEQWYVEPFAGGFNVIDKVAGNRIAADNHYFLIAMFKAIQAGWQPPLFISEESYRDIRDNKDKYAPELVGYVGFNSYGGKFFSGYRRDKQGQRNYWREHYNNLMVQKQGIEGVIIKHSDYRDLELPPKSLVYCDPPYLETTNYGDCFDHISFWQWARDTTLCGHKVFISEYRAPSDFICLWQAKVNNSLTQDTGAKSGTERLFVHDSSNLRELGLLLVWPK